MLEYKINVIKNNYKQLFVCALYLSAFGDDIMIFLYFYYPFS